MGIHLNLDKSFPDLLFLSEPLVLVDTYYTASFPSNFEKPKLMLWELGQIR